MSTGIRLLLNNLIIESEKGFMKGFIYVLGDKIEDLGGEPQPIYELSEYVNDYEGLGIALHGYSVLIDPVTYLINITGREHVEDLVSTLSSNELSRMIENTFHILFKSGITLPIIYTRYVDIVTRFMVEKKLYGVIIDVEGTSPRYKGLSYLNLRNGRLVRDDGLEIGSFEEIICDPWRIRDKCMILSLLKTHSLPHMFLPGLDPGLLRKPYRFMGIDKGFIDKGSIADILIYDLREPLSNIFTKLRPGRVVEWGKPPDTVIVHGDIFFERNESLVLEYHDLRSILEKIESGE